MHMGIIKNKFNIGDKVWIMMDNKPNEVEITTIKKIMISDYNDNSVKRFHLVYGVGFEGYCSEYEINRCVPVEHTSEQREFISDSDYYTESFNVFSTKEELLKSFM